MNVNVADLRRKPQINWLVPFGWMTKMTNEELHQWEKSVMEEERNNIIAERRPTWIDEEWNSERIQKEVIARTVDRARLLQIDYEKVVIA